MIACERGLDECIKSSLNIYKDIFISHNFWRETLQTLDEDETCVIPTLAQQWILCSEWVPSEWEFKQLIKTSIIKTFLTLNHCFQVNNHNASSSEKVHLLLSLTSDGTHSLQRMHWWASDVILYLSKSDEETNSSTSWMTWGWAPFQQTFIFRCTIPLSRNIKSCYRGRRTQWLVIFQIVMVSVQQWRCGEFKHCTCQGESSSSWTCPSALNRKELL